MSTMSKEDKRIVDGCGAIVEKVFRKTPHLKYHASIQLLSYLRGKAGRLLLGSRTPEQGLEIAINALVDKYLVTNVNSMYYFQMKKSSEVPLAIVSSSSQITPDECLSKPASLPNPNDASALIEGCAETIARVFRGNPKARFNTTTQIPLFFESKLGMELKGLRTDDEALKIVINGLKDRYENEIKNDKLYFRLKPADRSITKMTKKMESLTITSNVSAQSSSVPHQSDSNQHTMADVVGDSLRSPSEQRELEGDDEIIDFFHSRSEKISTSYSLISDWKNSSHFADSTLLGNLLDPLDKRTSKEKAVFLNTNEPFCLVAVGTQGNGKSHTVSCILESCLFPFPDVDIINLKTPMNAVVFHYDININYKCEAVGVTLPNPDLKMRGRSTPCLPKDKLTVLVSPQNYHNRKKFYADFGEVRPLMFSWKTLSADNIKKIMGIDQSGNQLYMHSLLEILRNYQRKNKPFPPFDEFVKEVMDTCTVPSQVGPLEQRLKLLESLIKESKVNQDLEGLSGDLKSCCNVPGTLVIVDLTDPLLARLEANCIFQVLAEQYCAVAPNSKKQRVARLLLIDEAHKFMDGVSTDGLSNAIVDIARLMRHQGIRLVVSTQSPKALAPELLELSSVAVMHQFTSREWFDHLAKKLPLDAPAFQRIMALNRGEALVFAKRHAVKSRFSGPSGVSATKEESGDASLNEVSVSDEEVDSDDKSSACATTTSSGGGGDNSFDSYQLDLSLGTNVFPVIIRQRVTKDLGASTCNV